MTLNPNFLDSYPITQSFFIINLCCFTRAALLNGHDGQALLAGLRNSPVSSWNTPWSSRSAKPWRAETSHKKIWGNHSKMLGKWGESMVLFPVNVAVIKSEKSWLTQCFMFQQTTFGYQRVVGLKNN